MLHEFEGKSQACELRALKSHACELRALKRKENSNNKKTGVRVQ
jgi:hypothetical protein